MSKRKPPSQRPERKMDETAQALDRLRKAGAEKPDRPGRLVSEELRSQNDRAQKLTSQVRAGGVAPSPVTRRQKSGGA